MTGLLTLGSMNSSQGECVPQILLLHLHLLKKSPVLSKKTSLSTSANDTISSIRTLLNPFDHIILRIRFYFIIHPLFNTSYFTSNFLNKTARSRI